MTPAEPTLAISTKRAAADPIMGFVEELGLVAQMEGRPRISGRLWGLFLAEGGPISLREAAARLKVSRASVSTNARALAAIGLIERAAVTGDRQDYYRLAPDPYRNLVAGMVAKLAQARAAIRRAAAALPNDHAAAKARAAALAGFYDAATAVIGELAARLPDAGETPAAGAEPHEPVGSEGQQDRISRGGLERIRPLPGS